MPDRYYVTSAIAYVNAPPHLGYMYEILACDVLARFNRLDGKDVMFLTGTDEHGQKVEQTALKAGQRPQAFVDEISTKFRELTRIMNLSNDDFIRTTDDRHKSSVQAFWQRLVETGNIYAGNYSGWYDQREEAFVGEDELVTSEDGRKLSPAGNECAWVEEPSYFFRLSAWQDRLLDLYETHPDFIGPTARRNEVISFVRGGLKDLSVSRTSFSWGVQVPGDEAHVMYVWIDALANYVSALGYPDKDGKYAQFWPADLHIVGKDIVRFHAVYWPAFLMAAGLPLPKRVFGHGWWTVEGQKMSKSVGNVIAPNELISTYGLDQTRYFLLRAFPFGNDGDFSCKAMVERINGDLANGLGNLAQRTLSMIAKNCEGRLPSIDAANEDDKALLFAASQLPAIMRQELAMQAFHKALDAAYAVISEADIYIDRQAPWTLRKTDFARMEIVLGTICRVLRVLGTCLSPFMPDTMASLLDQLGVPQDDRTLAALDRPMQSGISLPPPQGLFPRYVEPEAVA